jgi:hypothetical protein
MRVTLWLWSDHNVTLARLASARVTFVLWSDDNVTRVPPRLAAEGRRRDAGRQLPERMTAPVAGSTRAWAGLREIATSKEPSGVLPPASCAFALPFRPAATR